MKKLNISILLLFPTIFFLLSVEAAKRRTLLPRSDNAETNEANYHVGISTITGDIACGGTIVSKNVVITSYLCLKALAAFKLQFVVTAGIKSRREANQIRFALNVEYTRRYFLYDIAMVHVWPDFEMGETVNFINIADEGLDAGEGPMTIAGWGANGVLGTPWSEDLLISRNNYAKLSSKEFPGLLVVSNKDADWACLGDQGGGLVYKNKLVGTFAFGPLDCTDPAERIYSDIFAFREEITGFIQVFGQFKKDMTFGLLSKSIGFIAGNISSTAQKMAGIHGLGVQNVLKRKGAA